MNVGRNDSEGDFKLPCLSKHRGHHNFWYYRAFTSQHIRKTYRSHHQLRRTIREMETHETLLEICQPKILRK